MKKPVIELKDVWKTYKMGKVKVNALKGISLKIYPGEFLAIVGKSGSGKSTIMNLIGCLDVPSKGTIYLDGKDIGKLKESELAKIRGKKIGFVFQQFNLIQNMSALDNVALPGEFQDTPTLKLKNKARELLEFVDLKERIHHKPAELSGGQMQRVAIARSLINDPELILADEPTGALDSNTGNQLLEFLQDLNKNKKKSIVIVTHDLALTRHADRVIELKDGVIVKEVGGKNENI